MQRRLGIKRSFHCEDFASIVKSDQHDQMVDDIALVASPKRIKRHRTMSADSSSSTICCCRDAVAKTTALAPMRSSVARLISPATSHSHVAASDAAAVTPELTPALSSIALPCIPPLRAKARNESCDFPATAALECIMLKQRCKQPKRDLVGDFSPSFEDSCDEGSFSMWPNFDTEEDLLSPLQTQTSPGEARRVPMASRRSSSVSLQNLPNPRSSMPLSNQAPEVSLSSETASFNILPVSFLSLPTSRLLQPTKIITYQIMPPTVKEITQALSRM